MRREPPRTEGAPPPCASTHQIAAATDDPHVTDLLPRLDQALLDLIHVRPSMVDEDARSLHRDSPEKVPSKLCGPKKMGSSHR